MSSQAHGQLAPGMNAFIAASRLRTDGGESDANLLNVSIAEQRRAYDQSCEGLAEPRPSTVISHDQTLDSVRVRHYRLNVTASSHYLMWYHGGGFTLGGLESHDSFLAGLCANTGINVVAVDYRLAPEHPYPAALDDCYRATEAVAAGRLGNEPARLLVGGDSAGGNLAAAVCLRNTFDRPNGRGATRRIDGHLLVYPGLSATLDAPSFHEYANAPNLSRDDCLTYLRAYAGDDRLPHDDPLFAPLSAAQLSGLPAGFIFSAELDPLRDDAREWARRLIDGGVDTAYVEGAGLVHGFLRAAKFSPAAAAAIDRIQQAATLLCKAQ